MNKTWFTSYTHFNHNNIISYCNRSYRSVSEMNQAIMDKWNSVVSNHDFVYFLGDFGIHPKESINKHLVKIGNNV